MFYSVKDLVQQASKEKSLAELMLKVEQENTDRDRDEILKILERDLTVMKHSVAEGIKGVKSVTGLSGFDAKRMDTYLAAKHGISGTPVLKAVRNAIAVNEVNAKMGIICATPTAGSAGVLAGTLVAVTDELSLNHQDQLDYLLDAGAFGLVIANNAGIAGAEGGCQEEVGTASAMAAAAIVLAAGGTVEQASAAVAIDLQNIMGLVCDPVAGLVEVPCVKRNAMGASQAMVSADMDLSGMTSIIPTDEVIEAMRKVGLRMPLAFRETAEGGLAATPTGRKLQRKIFK